MCERVTDDEPAVVIHEHAHVQPIRAPQPEREDVRLPQLVRCRSLEATRPVFALRGRRRRLDETCLVQDLPHLLLAHAQSLEPRQHVTDAPRAPRLVLSLDRDHLLLDHRWCLQLTQPHLAAASALGVERARPMLAKRRRPLLHRGHRDAERRSDVLLCRTLHPLLNDQ
jgi:hypothetical protein